MANRDLPIATLSGWGTASDSPFEGRNTNGSKGRRSNHSRIVSTFIFEAYRDERLSTSIVGPMNGIQNALASEHWHRPKTLANAFALSMGWRETGGVPRSGESDPDGI